MINPINSNLYKQKSKKYLIKILHISNKNFLNQKYVSRQISPFILDTPKPRLIEAPSKELKNIQKEIKKELDKALIPNNIFSGVKGKSYIQNAKFHEGNNYLYKIDLKSFFLYINRNTVYNFFINIFKTSPDIAEILTNLLTVDLSKCSIQDMTSVNLFLTDKKINTTNHLISGSPASPILSYMVNYEMFDALQLFCDKNSIKMSVYIDDITFTSSNKISYKTKEIIKSIIQKHMYKVSNIKVKYYTKKYPKLVTGTIISSDGELKIKNALSLKIKNEWTYFKNNPQDLKSKKRLLGLISAAHQVEPQKYEYILNYIKKTCK